MALPAKKRLSPIVQDSAGEEIAMKGSQRRAEPKASKPLGSTKPSPVRAPLESGLSTSVAKP